MSVDGNGERSRGGRGAEGDCKAVLVLVLGAEAVEEDMLREARNGARGEKSRGGAHAVGEGRMVSHERRYSRGGRRNTIVVHRSMSLRGERKRQTGYIFFIRAGTISYSASITFERMVSGEEAAATSQVARKASRR